MKKILLSIIALLVVVPLLSVSAAVAYNVLTVEASIANNEMTVSGTTEHGVLAVAILVYDENEENLITMVSTGVTENDTYSEKIAIEDGNYVVKAANYNGGEYKVTNTKKSVVTTTTTQAVVETTTAKAENSPKTGDSIILYGTLFVVAFGAFVVINVLKNKKTNIK